MSEINAALTRSINRKSLNR